VIGVRELALVSLVVAVADGNVDIEALVFVMS